MKAVIGLFVACTLALPAGAADFPISLPGRDDLVFDLPIGWKAGIGRPNPDLPPTVQLRPVDGNDFQILITPIWPMGSAKAPTLADARGTVEDAARQAQPQAVERSLPLKELNGANTKGYYFFATDRQPEPGGFKYLAQGVAVLNELRISFTILVNGDPQKMTQQALDVVRTARRAPASR